MLLKFLFNLECGVLTKLNKNNACTILCWLKKYYVNTFSGASQADATILVVDATKGEFETGFDSGGQTREHALLIRSLGK